MKRCSSCQTEKPLADFYASQAYCKPCHREKQRVYAQQPHVREKRQAYGRMRRADPEFRARADEASRKWREENYDRYRLRVEDCVLRRRYGKSRDELQAMLAEQDGKCALCAVEVTWATRHVDHIDSANGPLVRGILCGKCNNGLGFFNESAALLAKAAAYVRYNDQFVNLANGLAELRESA